MNNKLKLQNLIFMALCCVLGLFGKRLVSPFTNVLTDALHIPGGISTAFSLMFIVIAAGITEKKWSGTLMGAVQSVLALLFGMVGSMGFLAPIGYIIPGLVTDIVVTLPRGRENNKTVRLFIANVLASVSASLTADIITFHLPGIALALYLCVAATSGAVMGYLAGVLYERLKRSKVFTQDDERYVK